ncbi:hypothetical protein F4805DRAFT_476463 [Annulohypoxylon moriforme]|nr:hypothetical protein F4805DRAFT_476463 [Annulohypoxylon moriforme]
MDPPTLSGKPMSFWGSMQKDIRATLDQNLMLLYFRAYGSATDVFPGHWRPVEWTLEDFVYFFDCPELESAWTAYVDEYLTNPLDDTSPSWWYVVDRMNYLLTRPDLLANYLNIRPASQINKSGWGHVDYIAAFIFRLLHYRNHIDEGKPQTRDDFQTRQAAYAQSFGRDNPFYARWDAVDKWAAGFLLFCKLSFERDAYYGGMEYANSRAAGRSTEQKPVPPQPKLPQIERTQPKQVSFEQQPTLFQQSQPKQLELQPTNQQPSESNGGKIPEQLMADLTWKLGAETARQYSEQILKGASTAEATELLNRLGYP